MPAGNKEAAALTMETMPRTPTLLRRPHLYTLRQRLLHCRSAAPQACRQLEECGKAAWHCMQRSIHPLCSLQGECHSPQHQGVQHQPCPGGIQRPPDVKHALQPEVGVRSSATSELVLGGRL